MPPTLPLHLWERHLGPPLQNWSTKNISRFLCWDFIKENSICIAYHSTSMSTLKHRLQVLMRCICKQQQHKREASLSSPLYWPWTFSWAKIRVYEKICWKFTSTGKTDFLHRLFHVQSEESRGSGCSKADGDIQVTVGTVEKYLTWSPQSLPQLLLAELELITLSSVY